MERGDRYQQFTVDPNTGHIIVVRPLDREMVIYLAAVSLFSYPLVWKKNTNRLSLSYSQVASYNLQIKATDGGIPEMTSYALVTIEVSDVNDNPPLFSSPNYTCVVQVWNSDYFVKLQNAREKIKWKNVIFQEDKIPGWTVCQLNVTDADISPNGAPFTFDIVSGNADSLFRIDANGMVRTTSRLKFRVQEVHEMHVRAFDNGVPPRYSDTKLTIKVMF